MLGKINLQLLKSLAPKSKPYQVHDTMLRRFFVRVQPTGVITYGCNVALPDGRRSTRIIGKHGVFTPAQARDEAGKILLQVRQGVDPYIEKKKAREHTLESFIDAEYAPWLKSRKKKGNEKGDARAEQKALVAIRELKSAFKEFLPKKLSTLTTWIFDKWKKETLNKGRKPATINRHLGRIQAALNKGITWGLIETNPVRKVERCKVSNSRTRYLSADEITCLYIELDKRDEKIRTARRNHNEWLRVRHLPPMPDLDKVFYVDHLRPMVEISISTGIRFGELTQLEPHHVDLQRKTLTIDGDISKNGKARHIPLNQLAHQALSKWIEQNKVTHSFLFPGKNGNTLDNVNKAWKRLLKDAGIEGFRWHDLRHTFASQLVINGVDLNTVRELLGHADMKMTLRYAHLAPHVMASAVSKLDELGKINSNIHFLHEE